MIGGADGLGSSASFADPSGMAVDSAGNLYVADSGNNAIRMGWLASGGLGVTITVPPQSQVAIAGATVSFSVTATGTGQLFYQWLFNGATIPGATSPTLTLNFVGADNSGAYSVMVWNAINSVVSAPACLAVLADCANGNQPAQVSGPPGPTKLPGQNNLVVVTHGCQPGPQVPPPPQWVSDMCNDIQAQVSSDWQVFPYFWTAQAWASTELLDVFVFRDLESKVMPNAKSLGVQLGKQIAAQGWEHVHFIGHSAGAALIQKAADTLRGLAPATEIHTTFLDPYLDLNYYGRSWYGSNADWADCYYALDTETANYTDGPLSYAYSVDVTWLDPNKTVTQIPCSSSTADSTAPVLDHYCSTTALSSHDWPHYFYSNSIVSTVPVCPAAAGYGFPLSKEGGGWANRGNYPPNGNPPVPCGSAPVNQNPLPLITGQPLQLTGLPQAASASGVNVFGGGFTMFGGPSQMLQQGDTKGGLQPLDATNGAVWLAIGLTVTNPVNFVAFDAGFTSTNAGQGLLTVYWNTNVIGMVDERVALATVQTYRFTLPGTFTNGLYTLGFRLDTFTNTTSSITVTNVATGFVGITQPITLDMLLMGSNNTPVLKLTAAPGYNYLVQSSTNLVDWSPTAMLVNTNGSVLFADPAATNCGARFYRALMP